MKTNTQSDKTPLLTQIMAGIFGGTIIGIALFLAMMTFGGNYGCWKPIDTLFGTAGYESCGSFGTIVGILVGVWLGINIIGKIKINNYTKAAGWLGLGSFLLPFAFGMTIFLSQLQSVGFVATVLMITAPILTFIAASAVVSVLVAGGVNWIKSRRVNRQTS